MYIYKSQLSATLTKYHRLDDLNNRSLFVTVLKAQCLRSGNQQGQILVRALFLASKQPPSCYALHGRERALWSLPLLITTPVLPGQDSTLTVSFYLHHIQSHGGLGLQHMNLRGLKFIIFFAAEDGEALYSQQKQDWELTVAQIMNSLLPNSGLN